MKDKIMIFMSCIIIILIGVILLMKTSDDKIEVKYKTITVNPWEVNYSKKDNYVFLGDSITDFYPLDQMFGSDVPAINSGVAGYKTTDLINKLDEMVYRYNPSKVILLIGTNDLKESQDTKDKTIENIKQIINNIRKNRSKAKIYVESIYPVNREMDQEIVEDRYNDEIIEVNREIKEFCKANEITFIDLTEILQDSNGNFNQEYTYDGLHPSTRGYVAITKELIKYLNE